MRDQIEAALLRVEAETGARILYACESGSRAWGFASQDSDYDVRFIYAHHHDWYLSILEHRDVIERMLPGDLDVSGWEIRKAMRLLRKSNPPLLEWLSSPIVYREDKRFVERVRELAASYYSLGSCFRHYLSMASGNIRNYFQGDTVRTKKYLYVLRPLLACRWIEQGRGPVAMEFSKLSPTVEDGEVVDSIRALVERKKAGGELESGTRDPVLSRFIDEEFPRLESLPFEREPLRPATKLDELFRDMVYGVEQ